MSMPFVSREEWETLDETTQQWFLGCLVCHGQLERYFGHCIACAGPAMFRIYEEGESDGYECTTCGHLYLSNELFPWPILEWNAEAMEHHFDEQGF